MMPPSAKPFLGDLKVDVNGDEIHGTAPLGPALEKMGAAMGGKVPAVGSAAAIGVVAALAIPAFVKNTDKAKTTEAVVNVKKLFDGARSYYEEESNGRGSVQPVAKQFPIGHMAPTPPLGTCCKDPGHKCAPMATYWTDPVWQALKFSMDDPHHYSYAYDSDGKTFSAQAYGDLDCDGTYSTFEMVGSIGADGEPTGQAGMFKDNELE